MKRPLFAPLCFSVRLPTLLAMFWRAHINREQASDLLRKGGPSFIIFRLDALGDVVMTTPLFRALKKAYPDSRCTVVVRNCYKSLLVTNPHIDEILTLPVIRPAWLPQRLRGLLAAALLYWTKLRKRHFDFAVSPRWDVDEQLATFLCVLTRATTRVGYTEKTSQAKQRINRGFDRAYDLCLPPGPARHEILRNLAVAKAMGATELNATLEVQLTETDRRRAAKLLARVPATTDLVAIGIGAGSPNRRWPLSRYAQVIEQLARIRPLQPVIVCCAAELGDAMKLAGKLSIAPIILSGAGLREACAVIERCELFIGNDSGCAHLAAAMNCRVIVISRHPLDGDANHFNSPLRFAPHCPNVGVLQPATGMEGCRGACRSLEAHCIRRISVDAVVAACRAMVHLKRASVSQPELSAWPDKAARSLLQSHSAPAIERAVEVLRSGNRPLTQL
ncbi:MAG TPA: glycosyltransferase family 9 protein [Terriglobales bacterium]|jgi:heptosyltransferase-2|nr:glycosyltransferase family 9 protein [Terriglobales bacterium]